MHVAQTYIVYMQYFFSTHVYSMCFYFVNWTIRIENKIDNFLIKFESKTVKQVRSFHIRNRTEKTLCIEKNEFGASQKEMYVHSATKRFAYFSSNKIVTLQVVRIGSHLTCIRSNWLQQQSKCDICEIWKKGFILN